MSDIILFEDIYEPIAFKIKNNKGDIFDIETQFRTVAINIEIEKLSGFKLDKAVKNLTENEKVCKAMVLLCGKDEIFWTQFHIDTLNNIMSKIKDLEVEKYKKKLEKK